MKTITLSLAMLILISCASNYHYVRRYKHGDQYQYRLTTRAERNGRVSESVAISQHKVVKGKGGVLCERIKWISLNGANPDKVDFESVLDNATPYTISLHRKGSVTLPDISDPYLTGIITDLNTFFVCLSPHTGISRLSEENQTYKDPNIHMGDFANSSTILFGKDCIQLTHKLLKMGKDTVVFESKYQPPVSGSCQQIAYKDLGLDSIQNFVMLQRSTNNRVNFFRGIEDFTIISKVDRHTGKLLYAEMVNNLMLEMQLNCTSEMEYCQGKYPIKIVRHVVLEPYKDEEDE